ncbi:hypothetical protein V6N12_068211 [Hibiscus sabdariffa]|uniref:Uncharacterized protein n=1 Tax=Hibiscus sabdariffa TaxID=183260 RepID=A0ABR2FPG0_9ROSI
MTMAEHHILPGEIMMISMNTFGHFIVLNLAGLGAKLHFSRSQHQGQRFQRPLLPYSMLGLEALTGTLDDFGFEDFLNDPRESETVRPVDLHHSMEVRLGYFV